MHSSRPPHAASARFHVRFIDAPSHSGPTVANVYPCRSLGWALTTLHLCGSHPFRRLGLGYCCNYRFPFFHPHCSAIARTPTLFVFRSFWLFVVVFVGLVRCFFFF